MKANKFIIKYFDLFRVVIAILIGFILSLLCILFISKDPLGTIAVYMFKPFDGIRRFGTMIEYMIPVMCTGCGMCFMLSVSKFNLIGEGALFLSASFITYVATQLTPNLPPIIFPIFLIVIGGIVGALCAYVPATLEAKWKTNIVVVTIMLNYVLTFAGMYILYYWMRDEKKTFIGSDLIPKAARLGNFIPHTNVHYGLFVAVGVVAFSYWFLYKTKLGYQMRLVGKNSNFAKYSGISVVVITILAQCIGGALAGIGGATETLGKYDRFIWLAQTGYGFDGMSLALMAKGNPLLIPIVAFILAYIRIGADIVGQTTDVPLEFVQVIQSIIIMLVAAGSFLSSYRQKKIVKVAKYEELQKAEAAEAK